MGEQRTTYREDPSSWVYRVGVPVGAAVLFLAAVAVWRQRRGGYAVLPQSAPAWVGLAVIVLGAAVWGAFNLELLPTKPRQGDAIRVTEDELLVDGVSFPLTDVDLARLPSGVGLDGPELVRVPTHDGSDYGVTARDPRAFLDALRAAAHARQEDGPSQPRTRG